MLIEIYLNLKECWNYFNMINELTKYIGISFEEFSKETTQILEKHFHPAPNEKNFSIYFEENEYLFIDNLISSIEFSNLKSLKKRIKNFTINERIEQDLEYFTSNNISWEIYSKYSYKKYLIIKVMNCIFYEYEYNKNRFILNLIRISKNE